MTPRLKLATRRSPLAMVQARMVAAGLCAAHGWPEDAVEILAMVSTGDRISDRPLAEVGGKGLFTKELEEALHARRADLAVHSMKDVETVLAPEFRIGAVLRRADPSDRLLTLGGEALDALPRGARVGTSSLRRGAQLLHARPDLRIVSFRGNVDTRIGKLRAGEAEATILAAAGLDRLGRPDIGCAMPHDVMLPAPAQGAVGIELRSDDEATAELITPLNDPASAAAVAAERAFLRALDGSCRTPIAAHATIAGDLLDLTGELLSTDGRVRARGFRSGPVTDGAALALELAAEVKADYAGKGGG